MRYLALIVCVIILSSVSIGITQESDESETYQQLDLFSTVFEQIRSTYVESVSDDALIEAAIKGMFSALDPHSSLLTPQVYRDMQLQTTGSFGGLGIEVIMENGLIKVVSPIDDTPAFHAGIQSGDLITHLDSEPILGMTLNQAVEKMRGTPGTEITLTVQRRENETFDITITRAIIQISSVRHRIEDDDIGYIRITTFNGHAYSNLQKAMTDIHEQKGDDLKGLILDLRNNPGGLLEQAVLVSDAFLNQGEIVSIRGRDNQNSQRFNAQTGDISEGLPLIILINSGSASASEIVAGALQDHRRALILGVRSFGKGSVQTVIPLPSHESAVRLTTARYYTPSGRSIQQRGIVPDIEIDQAQISVDLAQRRRREADLPGSLENEQLDEDERTFQETEQLQVDYQLARAVDLLKGVWFFSNQSARIP
jgi:carboxyl-terminal processing protease